MFAVFIGYSSILLGISWILKPDILRNQFLQKTHKSFFWFTLGLLFYPMGYFGKRVGIAGIVVILVLFWVAMKMTHEKMSQFFRKIPRLPFQVFGLVNIASGCTLLLWHK